jgi:hypothetical protein
MKPSGINQRVIGQRDVKGKRVNHCQVCDSLDTLVDQLLEGDCYYCLSLPVFEERDHEAVPRCKCLANMFGCMVGHSLAIYP